MESSDYKKNDDNQMLRVDLYDEDEIRGQFGIPKYDKIDLTKEFAIEIDREGLQVCNSKLYSIDNYEMVAEQSKGICSNYDFWFMLFDMAIFPHFRTNSSDTILACSLHYKVYIAQLFRYMVYKFEKNNLMYYLPYSYRYYQLRTNYLMEMSKYRIGKEVVFIPVKTKIPNATAIKCDNGIKAIKIGVGLEYLLDRLSRFTEYAEIKGVDYLNVIFENLKIQIVLITLFFYGKITSTQVLGAFITPDSGMNKCRNRRIEQMDFILCHEMGHIYYDNLDDAANKEIEVKSDDFALDVLMSDPDRTNKYERRSKEQVLSSVLILFKELVIVEKLYKQISCIMNWDNPITDEDHPSYNERYASMRNTINGIGDLAAEDEETLMLLDKLDKIFEKWPSESLKEYVEKQLDIDSSEIKKLVKESVDNVL